MTIDKPIERAVVIEAEGQARKVLLDLYAKDDDRIQYLTRVDDAHFAIAGKLHEVETVFRSNMHRYEDGDPKRIRLRNATVSLTDEALRTD